MRQGPVLLSRLSIVLLLGLAACTRPDNCDATNAGSIFTASACLHTGGYDAALATARAEVARTGAEIALNQEETARLENEARMLAADQAAMEERVGELDAQLRALHARLAAVEAANADDEARLAALQEELEEADAAVAAMRAGEAVTPEEIVRLTQEVEERQRTVIELYETYGYE